MMSYFERTKGVTFETLLGSTDVAFLYRAVNVDTTDTAVARGMLLAGHGVGSEMTVAPATAADTDATLLIAAEDFVPTATNQTTVAFTSGVFNRSALIVDSSCSLDDFEEALRRDNIILTDIISKGGDT